MYPDLRKDKGRKGGKEGERKRKREGRDERHRKKIGHQVIHSNDIYLVANLGRSPHIDFGEFKR